jgi:hypothetical protein
MAALAVVHERRSEERRTANSVRCRADGVLRPGQPVVVVNIKGRLDRCHVSALEPLRYRGVLVFEQQLTLPHDATN